MSLDQFVSSVIATDSIDERRKSRSQVARYSLPVEGPIGGIAEGADLMIRDSISIHLRNQNLRR